MAIISANILFRNANDTDSERSRRDLSIGAMAQVSAAEHDSGDTTATLKHSDASRFRSMALEQSKYCLQDRVERSWSNLRIIQFDFLTEVAMAVHSPSLPMPGLVQHRAWLWQHPLNAPRLLFHGRCLSSGGVPQQPPSHRLRLSPGWQYLHLTTHIPGNKKAVFMEPATCISNLHLHLLNQTTVWQCAKKPARKARVEL